MNAVSSRSYMLTKMTVVLKLKDGTIRIATANFADLAGSDKVQKTGARDTRLVKAKSINKSLSVLGMVINALSSGKQKHVPFQDSMLTHLLRDSLGGNCKTTVLVTVSPHKYNRVETINSLRFGRRCKLVRNKASVNIVYSNNEIFGAKEKAHTDLLHMEKESIKSQLTAHRSALTKSHHLLTKQNKLLKQRESKLYSLVEKQTTYLDGMNHLRNIQIGMDEDAVKRLL
eukprot:427760_1